MLCTNGRQVPSTVHSSSCINTVIAMFRLPTKTPGSAGGSTALGAYRFDANGHLARSGLFDAQLLDGNWGAMSNPWMTYTTPLPPQVGDCHRGTVQPDTVVHAKEEAVFLHGRHGLSVRDAAGGNALPGDNAGAPQHRRPPPPHSGQTVAVEWPPEASSSSSGQGRWSGAGAT